MTSPRLLPLLAILLAVSGTLQAEPPETKEVAHARSLEKLYPTPAFKVLSEMKVSQQLYQDAVNEAYAAGMPSHLLSEFVALRAMKNADAKTLQLALPALKAGLGKYQPESSLFPDEASETTAIKTMERVLLEEQETPGTLAKKARFSAERTIARNIRSQLDAVEALVDGEAIQKNLVRGTPVTEARWRAQARPGTRFASTATDELGNPFGPQLVGVKPTVPKASYERLKAVVPDSFWSPFGIPK